MNKQDRKVELRAFLKNCRARLRPEDVGIASTGRRRVPGLRREEVAELCDVSLAWYTLLETARDIRVSPRLLDRLSYVLRLSDDEKMHLFSLAMDELSTIPRATLHSRGPTANEYSKLRTFTHCTRSVSCVQELAHLTSDLLFDLGERVENAHFIVADIATRKFTFISQRCAGSFPPVPGKRFHFSSVHDSKEVFVGGGLAMESNVAERHLHPFAAAAKELGAGRFISKGVHASSFNGAIGYFEASNKPFAEHEREQLTLVAEIVYLALPTCFTSSAPVSEVV